MDKIENKYFVNVRCQIIINGLQQLSFACMFVVVFEEGSVVIPTQVLKRSERNEKGFVPTYLLAAMCVHIVLFFYCCHVRDTYWKIPFADDRAPSPSNSFGWTVA